MNEGCGYYELCADCLKGNAACTAGEGEKMEVYKKQTERVVLALDQAYNKFIQLEDESTDEAEICAYRCYYTNIYESKLYVEQMQKEIDRLKAEQPKHGHWIIDEYEYLDCSCCGESYYTGCDCTEDAKHRLETGDVYKFCPYCGARMDGEQDGI